jgi:hypothetical protein
MDEIATVMSKAVDVAVDGDGAGAHAAAHTPRTAAALRAARAKAQQQPLEEVVQVGASHRMAGGLALPPTPE